METVDPELFARCRASDASAWNQLIAAHAPLVYAVARKQGLREDQCDDVAQSIFSTLVRKIDSIRDAKALPAWLIVSTQREAWRVRRTAARMLQAPEHAEEPAAEHDIGRLESLHRLRLGLEELGGRCKELLTLLFLADPAPDYQSIGETLGMPVGSIGPTRSRCLTKLAEIIHKD